MPSPLIIRRSLTLTHAPQKPSPFISLTHLSRGSIVTLLSQICCVFNLLIIDLLLNFSSLAQMVMQFRYSVQLIYYCILVQFTEMMKYDFEVLLLVDIFSKTE
jgi:hypothetical protein